MQIPHARTERFAPVRVIRVKQFRNRTALPVLDYTARYRATLVNRSTIMRKLSLIAASSAVVAMAAPGVMQAQTQDIVETAVAAGTFKSFTRALADAGLTETLKGPGPYTVLIPSDAAFAKLPKGTLDALFKDKSALRNMLLYHVIAGKLTAADFSHLNGKGRKTFEGSETRIGVVGSQLTIGTANVVQSDMMAKNGVIHIIDTVLIPPGR